MKYLVIFLFLLLPMHTAFAACATNHAVAHCGSSCGGRSPTPNPTGSLGDDTYIPVTAPYGAANAVIATFQVCPGGSIELIQDLGGPPQYTVYYWEFHVDANGQAAMDTLLVDYVQILARTGPGQDCPPYATGCIGAYAYYDDVSYAGSGWWSKSP
ncbi:hypothetical protein [Dyella flagellata]|uniref:Uncharacterized protein n=1 Tax=Dyella flagellata TaxID=1867833 RepID=A0ABQ5XGU5_9GAMM|nr:hypothetical protein [Dyella flagellata]GLQ89758.1 hypothetical protein GCM10007898_33330 [Dyella flagellata]